VEKQLLSTISKRWVYGVWLLLIGGFASLHALHLTADFPNHSPWMSDWAKYTDEGWYGNAAIRAHLFGNWYLPGDFNPAPAVPVWPFLEWLLFFMTGVSVAAARGLAVFFFLANLILSYLLLQARGPHARRWTGLLAITFLVTSPFLYCFSRLAILEPMLTALMLVALNVIVRLPRIRRPMAASIGVGLIFTLMMLTKTTAIFLLPSLAWAFLASLWQKQPLSMNKGMQPWVGRVARNCSLAAFGAFAITFGSWMAIVVHLGLFSDYKYLFFVNNYIKPANFYWPFLSFWWSFHGGLWVDHILIPLAGALFLAAIAAGIARPKRTSWGRRLLMDPVFGASIAAIAGYVLFMTYQNHPQPRYFAVVSVFCFLIVAIGTEALLVQPGTARSLGWAVFALAASAILANGMWTLSFATHPEYSFVNAARQLSTFIDGHPNGNRLLVSISGDEISLVTQIPALCDDFGTPSRTYPDLATKLHLYQPGWWATWNDIDPGTLEDIHKHFSLEQVASFRAFDDPERNSLVLFKLHPLPRGTVRELDPATLQAPLPEDRISIPVE
jgi:hypothetical protein